MEILRTISFYTEAKGMPFLVIGGHALNEYGLARQTGDLDLLVPSIQKNEWVKLFKRLQYTSYQDDNFFSRFKAVELTSWPIDLMFVAKDTFDKIYADSSINHFGIDNVRIISVKHLIILKLHALKIYQEHRHAKDFTDLLFLLKNHKNVLKSEELKELCNKYATAELYDKIKIEL